MGGVRNRTQGPRLESLVREVWSRQLQLCGTETWAITSYQKAWVQTGVRSKWFWAAGWNKYSAVRNQLAEIKNKDEARKQEFSKQDPRNWKQIGTRNQKTGRNKESEAPGQMETSVLLSNVLGTSHTVIYKQTSTTQAGNWDQLKIARLLAARPIQGSSGRNLSGLLPWPLTDEITESKYCNSVLIHFSPLQLPWDQKEGNLTQELHCQH